MSSCWAFQHCRKPDCTRSVRFAICPARSASSWWRPTQHSRLGRFNVARRRTSSKRQARRNYSQESALPCQGDPESLRGRGTRLFVRDIATPNREQYRAPRESSVNAQPLMCPQCGKPTAVLLAHPASDRTTGHYSCLACANSMCQKCSTIEQFSTDNHVGELTGPTTVH